jgi:hypothetical protein
MHHSNLISQSVTGIIGVPIEPLRLLKREAVWFSTDPTQDKVLLKSLQDNVTSLYGSTKPNYKI